MAITWKEEYTTRDQRIDEQRQQIFRFANRLETLAKEEQADSQEVDSLLRFLDAYVQNHFRYEEACMLKRRCPIAQQNRSEHLAFKTFYARSVATYHSDGYSPEWALGLHQRIQNWLTTHICRINVQLRDHPDPTAASESGTPKKPGSR